MLKNRKWKGLRILFFIILTTGYRRKKTEKSSKERYFLLFKCICIHFSYRNITTELCMSMATKNSVIPKSSVWSGRYSLRGFDTIKIFCSCKVLLWAAPIQCISEILPFKLNQFLENQTIRRWHGLRKRKFNIATAELLRRALREEKIDREFLISMFEYTNNFKRQVSIINEITNDIYISRKYYTHAWKSSKILSE